MSETNRVQQINALHAEYLRLTGFKISLAGREWCWFEWIKRELGPEELRLLVREKRRRIAAGELTIQSLAFRNLVGNADYAEEDVAELRARNRSRFPSSEGSGVGSPDRASILRQTGRPVAQASSPAGSSGIPARDVIQKLQDPAACEKALAELRQLKNSL